MRLFTTTAGLPPMAYLGRLRVELTASKLLHTDDAISRIGESVGPSPVDRARPGSKHHVLTEGANIPLAVSLTGGNRNDCEDNFWLSQVGCLTRATTDSGVWVTICRHQAWGGACCRQTGKACPDRGLAANKAPSQS